MMGGMMRGHLLDELRLGGRRPPGGEPIEGGGVGRLGRRRRPRGAEAVAQGRPEPAPHGLHHLCPRLTGASVERHDGWGLWKQTTAYLDQ